MNEATKTQSTHEAAGGLYARLTRVLLENTKMRGHTIGMVGNQLVPFIQAEIAAAISDRAPVASAAALSELCAEMVRLHKDHGAVLMVHMAEMERLLGGAPIAQGTAIHGLPAMTRAHNPDDICAMCDEYDGESKKADPAYRDIGMGICQKRVDTPMYSLTYVAWNNQTCVSYRLDKPNLAARRQYVSIQQRTQEPKP